MAARHVNVAALRAIDRVTSILMAMRAAARRTERSSQGLPHTGARQVRSARWTQGAQVAARGYPYAT
eukprot:SAG31_NODE_2062_length_6536_cov_8.777691_9_plen_67_part_00